MDVHSARPPTSIVAGPSPQCMSNRGGTRGQAARVDMHSTPAPTSIVAGPSPQCMSNRGYFQSWILRTIADLDGHDDIGGTRGHAQHARPYFNRRRPFAAVHVQSWIFQALSNIAVIR